jgi:hypothetical protein
MKTEYPNEGKWKSKNQYTASTRVKGITRIEKIKKTQ